MDTSQKELNDQFLKDYDFGVTEFKNSENYKNNSEGLLTAENGELLKQNEELNKRLVVVKDYQAGTKIANNRLAELQKSLENAEGLEKQNIENQIKEIENKQKDIQGKINENKSKVDINLLKIQGMRDFEKYLKERRETIDSSLTVDQIKGEMVDKFNRLVENPTNQKNLQETNKPIAEKYSENEVKKDKKNKTTPTDKQFQNAKGYVEAHPEQFQEFFNFQKEDLGLHDYIDSFNAKKGLREQTTAELEDQLGHLGRVAADANASQMESRKIAKELRDEYEQLDEKYGVFAWLLNIDGCRDRMDDLLKEVRKKERESLQQSQNASSALGVKNQVVQAGLANFVNQVNQQQQNIHAINLKTNAGALVEEKRNFQSAPVGSHLEKMAQKKYQDKQIAFTGKSFER